MKCIASVTHYLQFVALPYPGTRISAAEPLSSCPQSSANQVDGHWQ